MALVINSNLASLNAQRNLVNTQMDLSRSLQRLSSGLRINSARDDAAGLYAVEKMSADIRGINQAVANAADGISLAQTAEGALGQIANNLQRIREIAVQAANATVEDRTGLQKEVDQLTQEISRIVDTTEFNSKELLTNTTALKFQVGQDGDADNQLSVNGVDLDTAGSAGMHTYNSSQSATGVVDVDDAAGASAALANIEDDIEKVAQSRATFGAVQNRFDAVIANLQNYSENLSAARSRLQDADFAQETANLTRAQILQQAGVAMLAQANLQPQTVLALLQ